MTQVEQSDVPGRPRWVVINWTLEALGLVRAIAAAHEDGGPALDLVGPAPPDAVAAALAESPRHQRVRYWQGSAAAGVEPLARLLELSVAAASAASVIVLPLRGHGETDAFSRLTCTALHRACAGRPPHVVVAVDDPEATHEFEGLGVATIFYPGFLRAALLAHACVDLGAFQFMLALLRGGLRVETWPVPPELRAAAFRDACLQIEEDAQGRPVTLLGLFAPGPDGAQSMLLSPGPGQPLRDASGLLVLTGQEGG